MYTICCSLSAWDYENWSSQEQSISQTPLQPITKTAIEISCSILESLQEDPGGFFNMHACLRQFFFFSLLLIERHYMFAATITVSQQPCPLPIRINWMPIWYAFSALEIRYPRGVESGVVSFCWGKMAILSNTVFHLPPWAHIIHQGLLIFWKPTDEGRQIFEFIPIYYRQVLWFCW